LNVFYKILIESFATLTR